MNNRVSSSAPWKATGLFPGLVVLVYLGSCNTGPSEVEMAARSEADRLKNELVVRDSLISEMALSFDEIEQTFSMFDEREKLLGESAAGELNLDKRQKIVRDVQLMNSPMPSGA